MMRPAHRLPVGHPRAAVVYTLAAGAMTELESVSGRKATILNPTRDDETAAVLRRRLFSAVDLSRAGSVVEQYRALWAANRDALSEEGRHARTA